jgi:hypothetical protein
MYVNPFIAGILTTILVEAILLISLTVYINTKGDR